MQLFSDLLKEGDTSTAEAGKSGPKNMLEDLPDTFSQTQLEALRTQLGKNKEGANTQLRNWKSRGFITLDPSTNLYSKTSEYLNGK